MALNYRDLCEARLPDLRNKLREAEEQHTPAQLTAQLLEAIENDLVPTIVLTIWIGMSRNPQCVVDCLASPSRFVRGDCIRKIGQWLRSSQWETMWAALDGVRGLVDLLSRSSLDEVILLVKLLRKAVPTSRGDEDRRRTLFTDFYKCLFPQTFTDAVYPSQDGRELKSIYLRLLPVCTSSFVMQQLESSTATGSPWARHMFQDLRIPWHHSTVIENAILNSLETGSEFANTAQNFVWFLARSCPGESNRKNWSRSMCFSMKVLEALPAYEWGDLRGQNLMDKLIVPLLGRARYAYKSWSSVSEVIQAVLTYAQSDEDLVYCFDRFQNGKCFLLYVFDLWARRLEGSEEALLAALQLVGARRGLQYYPGSYPGDSNILLTRVHKPRRYELFKLMLRYAFKPALDLDNKSGIYTWVTKGGMCSDLFAASFPELRSRDKLDLFDRLSAVPGFQASHLPDQREFGYESLPNDCEKTDARLFRFKLRKASPQLSADAQAAITELMEDTVRSRDMVERLLYTCTVLSYAVASHDLGIYGDCLEWSRRFVRDPFVSTNLFEITFRYVMEPFTSIAVLGGIDLDDLVSFLAGTEKGQGSSPGEVRNYVVKANDILRIWIRIARDCLREPHFEECTPDYTKILLQNVVSYRIKGAASVRERLNIEQEELYDTIFADTLSFLVEAQEIGLNPEWKNMRLLQHDMGYGIHKVKTSEAAAWRFIDELARSRDALWVQARMAQNPNVGDLSPIWPRGLPLHALLTIKPDANFLSGARLPFIEERARFFLFAPAAHTCMPIPSDKEQMAIAHYRNSYHTALRIYVFTARDRDAQTARLKEVWKHAATEMSEDLEDPEWRSNRWKQVFSRHLGELFDWEHLEQAQTGPTIGENTGTGCPWYSVHVPEDYGNSIEWSPLEHIRSESKAEYREPSTIDIMIEGSSAYIPPDRPLDVRIKNKIQLDTRAPESVFTLTQQTRSSGQELEGRIAGAILWLDREKGGATSVLSKGFPACEGQAGKQRRLPSLLLDSDLRYEEVPSVKGILSFLSENQRRVPMRLVWLLAREALEVLKSLDDDSPQTARVEAVLFQSLKLIIGAPFATSLVCDAVLQLPGSSSWHRHVINRRLLRRLGPDMAHDFIKTFTARISEINRQRRLSPAADTEAEANEKPAVVKVTTFKLVAQLLDYSAVFSVPSAFKILADILSTDPHPDVRDAVMDSACSILSTTSATELDTKTTELAQGLLLSFQPILAALDERSGPVSWTDWTVAQDLPRVGTERRLFYNLVKICQSTSLPGHWRDFLATNLLIPAVQANIKVYTEWLQRFQEKYSTNPSQSWEYSKVPNITSHSSMLRAVILDLPRFAPKEFLLLWQQWVLATSELARESTEDEPNVLDFGQDLSTAKSIERDTWYSAFTPAHNVSSEAHELFEMLRNRLDWRLHEQGICLGDVQDCVLRFAETVVDNPEEGEPQLTSGYFRQFAPSKKQHEHETWKVQCDPVIRRLIEVIELRRSFSRQQSTSRNPAWLPDTFILRTFLWRYPKNDEDSSSEVNTSGSDEDAPSEEEESGSNGGASGSNEDEFGSDDVMSGIGDLLEDMTVDLGQLRARKFLWVKELEAAKDSLEGMMTYKQKIELCREMGSLHAISTKDTEEAVMRVKLVELLLKGHLEPDRKIAAKLLNSEIEEVRESAWAVLRTKE